ncbi:MAG: alpha/beta hydrolase [Anaerolineae bacterium]
MQYVKNGQLAYPDSGAGEKVIVALHGHYGRSRYFAPLAEALPDWRVIALDQRGHGWSAHTGDYSREGYLADLELLLDTLKLQQVVFVGFSLGGVNAYQFAARHPERVLAMVIEDIGAVLQADDLEAVRNFPARFPSVRAARDFIVGRGLGDGMYFLESLVEQDDGWAFRFDVEGLVRSQQAYYGDWWADWLATKHPILLLHGAESDMLPAAHAQEMAARRPNTTLVTFPDCGHGILGGNPEGYLRAVRSFLETVMDAKVRL